MKCISREPNRFRWNEMYLEEWNVFGGNEIYLEGTKSIWRERNLFGGNDADFGRTKCISREWNIFRGHEMYLEGSKYISMERNNISEFPHVPSGDPYFRGSVSGSVVKVGQSLILPWLSCALTPAPGFARLNWTKVPTLKEKRQWL